MRFDPALMNDESLLSRSQFVEPSRWQFAESPLRYLTKRVSEQQLNSLLKGTWLG
ncbi:unnamed protein product [Anisakis simplex]|uniref:Uncharacterized protein n=1 Tax=Anisakis simplex TaxID=6269 RepID=A0A3P6PF17_ANISI|nr:unnamed protein product [Anisakis simplex]